MNPLALIILIPIICGITGLIISRLRNEFNFLGAILTLYYSLYLFITTQKVKFISYKLFTVSNLDFSLYLDKFGSVLILLITLISFLLLLYSFRSMRGYKHTGAYYMYTLFTISIANGFVLANNLVFLMIFSVLLAILLYGFLITVSDSSRTTANRTFLFMILSNLIIILGISVLLIHTGSALIYSEPKLIPHNVQLVTSFILILIGIIMKIGIMPFHGWTLKLLKGTPISIFTLIPMFIDKIVGIYLLIRLSYFLFNINEAIAIRLLISIIGGISIILAAFMALKTKDIYRLLTFNAIVQFGFIFIGIGCANPFGLASGIFHLVNYSTFQPSLLLSAGSIEYWTKTTSLENFGGLASKMPLTFFALLIALLASSGVPPLNGFFSKWLLFQGILNTNGFNIFSPILIIITLFGYIVTPIYFLRLLYAFRGTEIKYSQRIRDPGFTMWFPPVLLSVFCIALGVFTVSLVWNSIILPSLTSLFTHISLINPWAFGLAPALAVFSLLVGIIIFYTSGVSFRTRSI